MKQLENKTVVITGAGSGMGKSMALLFASEGAYVVASDVHTETVNATINEIKSHGGKAIAAVTNVASEKDVNDLIELAVKTYGTVDVLINNAGILDDFMPVADASTELWNKVMAVNVNGPFFACRKAIPIMLKQQKGVIINIASIGGFCGSRAGVAYTASKHAVIGLTKNIGFMYAQNGIRCNAIAPGGVATNIGQGMNPNKLGYEKLSLGMGTNPRMGTPDEIAQLALFLATDKSSFINGSVITADGGWTAY
jgi:NAD(P)-dependent dehydrogenase (short-subunit alcohol dehydrogenase family)